MIGIMRAIALLKPKVKVTAIICATENMPSGKAQKPGDVQIAMSGKSIEIINTDAEGRLILADGLMLCPATRLHPPGRCGHAYRRGRCGARLCQCRHLRQHRRHCTSASRKANQQGRRKNLAPAAGRRL